MDPLIRRYEPDDLPAMISLWNEIVDAGNYFPQEDRLDMETGAKFFQAQSYCGVQKNGALSGLYILHPNNVGRCAHICNASYAVSKAARGHGIGKALVRDSILQARKLGFKIMQFNAVLENNRIARHLYHNLGFRELGKIAGGFRNKAGIYEDICLYWLPL